MAAFSYCNGLLLIILFSPLPLDSFFWDVSVGGWVCSFVFFPFSFHFLRLGAKRDEKKSGTSAYNSRFASHHFVFLPCGRFHRTYNCAWSAFSSSCSPSLSELSFTSFLRPLPFHHFFSSHLDFVSITHSLLFLASFLFSWLCNAVF